MEPFVNGPAVSRDRAVVVEDRVRVGEMVACIEAGRRAVRAETGVVEVDGGWGVAEGHKSVALSFTFQGERTLTDEDVHAEIESISALLQEEFGARIRT